MQHLWFCFSIHCCDIDSNNKLKVSKSFIYLFFFFFLCQFCPLKGSDFMVRMETSILIFWIIFYKAGTEKWQIKLHSCMHNYSSEKKKNGMEREKRDGKEKTGRRKGENQPRIPHSFFSIRYCLTPLNGCE